MKIEIEKIGNGYLVTSGTDRQVASSFTELCRCIYILIFETSKLPDISSVVSKIKKKVIAQSRDETINNP